MSDTLDLRAARSVGAAHRLAWQLAKIPIRGSLRLGQAVSKVLVPKPTQPVLIRTRYGFDMVLHPHQDKGVDRTLYLTGTTERETLHVMQQLLSHGDTCIDAGANIGLMTLLAAQRVGAQGRVYAFEPCSDTAARLRLNVSLNGFSNVEVIQCALSSFPGEATLHVELEHRGMSALVSDGSPPAEGRTETVRVETLDDLTARGCIPFPIKLLKIDVEGLECAVLKGARRVLSRPDKPALIVEWCPGRSRSDPAGQDMWRLLAELGSYRFFKPPHGLYRVGPLCEVRHARELGAFTNLFAFTDQHVRQIS